MKRVLLVVIVVLVVLGALAAVGWAQVAPIVHPDLEQPLVFPHSRHVAVAQIDCTFCHRGTTQVRTASAGYPSVQQCLFCHKIVTAERPAIQKLQAAADKNEQIDWVRVYRLPDHVHFLHEPHIRAGFDCSTCHGDVRNMEQVTQARVLRMGDCMNCHRANNARTDCSVCHY